jgi:hypothetical protein
MSPQRHDIVQAIRAAALRLAGRTGVPLKIGRFESVEATVDGLLITVSDHHGEELVDIWGDGKVFSLWTYDEAGTDQHLVKFKNGPWVEQLFAASPGLRVVH